MLSNLDVKVTVNDAWEAVKTMRLGVTRVQNAKKQLEAIKFGNGEDIDNFACACRPSCRSSGCSA
jgi:hypothetical protein